MTTQDSGAPMQRGLRIWYGLKTPFAASFCWLSACGAVSGSSGGDDLMHVPGIIRQMATAEIQADGKLHVQRRGRFKIKPETRQCVAEPMISRSLKNAGFRLVGVNLDEVYKKLGQPRYLNGSPRHGKMGPTCRDDGTNIVMQWTVELNRAGRPYRLVLAVWQGEAVWVGGVVREHDLNLKAEYAQPIEGGAVPLITQIQGSIRADSRDLVLKFISAFDGVAK